MIQRLRAFLRHAIAPRPNLDLPEAEPNPALPEALREQRRLEHELRRIEIIQRRRRLVERHE